MRARSIIIFVGVVLLLAFVALNWSTFVTPTVFSLGFAAYEAPLWVVMLGLVGAVAALFAIHTIFWQGSVILESRRHAKELQSQRALVDQAEASRIAELRAAMQENMDRLALRIEQSQEAMRTELRESTNSLAAMIGEFEDRVASRPPLR
ncbi:LapA family protein [Piscinibacter koreensis]|uniref:LapA family protein n=1 Tax=Piscinibacter koreensis TaxID=2742824 RepID=A0A7Y6NKC0_9BURK|nr:LapA family protein [Schlegelella koreensis]NUZ04771.1 LapA family protein [Schlegelella koreensis]